jgi:hypothetical protein
MRPPVSTGTSFRMKESFSAPISRLPIRAAAQGGDAVEDAGEDAVGEIVELGVAAQVLLEALGRRPMQQVGKIMAQGSDGGGEVFQADLHDEQGSGPGPFPAQAPVDVEAHLQPVGQPCHRIPTALQAEPFRHRARQSAGQHQESGPRQPVGRLLGDALDDVERHQRAEDNPPVQRRQQAARHAEQARGEDDRQIDEMDVDIGRAAGFVDHQIGRADQRQHDSGPAGLPGGGMAGPAFMKRQPAGRRRGALNRYGHIGRLPTSVGGFRRTGWQVFFLP